MDLKKLIREVPDFPKAGILFYDITTLLKDSAGFVPVRKPKKLPAATVSVTYDLEYGQDSLEMHKDAVQPGSRVLIVDDLLATGGTAAAAARLVREAGGTVAGLGFVVELTFLSGRAKLPEYDVFSLLQYDQ